jgi:hypothetical protein
MDDPLLGFIGVFNADHYAHFESKMRTPLAGLIAEIIVHPQWNQTTRNADIALVRLKQDIVYTSKNISPYYLFKKSFGLIINKTIYALQIKRHYKTSLSSEFP